MELVHDMYNFGMLPIRTPIALQGSALCFIRAEPSFPFHWHHHPEVELVLITAGSGMRFVGDSVEPYEPGDLILIGPDLPHTWAGESKGRHEAVVVQFPLTGPLGGLLWEAAETTGIRRMLKRAGHGLRFPPATARRLRRRLVELPGLPPLERLTRLAHVLDELGRDKAKTLSAGGPHAASAVDARRLAKVEAFLRGQTGARVRSADAAKAAGLAPADFCRFFRRATGRTFLAHVHEVRLGRAAWMLAETRMPVATVASQCGYANLALFHRRFKAKFGRTPRAHRERIGAA